jgi:hypothetical protein
MPFLARPAALRRWRRRERLSLRADNLFDLAVMPVYDVPRAVIIRVLGQCLNGSARGGAECFQLPFGTLFWRCPQDWHCTLPSPTARLFAKQPGKKPLLRYFHFNDAGDWLLLP